MTYAKSPKKNKSRRSRGIAVLNASLLLAIVALAILYISQVNSLVSASFRIRSEKERLEEMKISNQQFEAAIAKLQSPLNLEEKIKGLEMVEAGKVGYLKIEKEMAVRK